MLSAKPIPLQAADPLLTDQPAKEMYTFSLVAGSAGPAAASGILKATQPPSIPGAGSGQVPPPAGKGNALLDEASTQADSLFNQAGSLPDNSNAAAPPPRQQYVPGNGESVNSVLQDTGDNLPGDSGTNKVVQGDSASLSPGEADQELSGLLSSGNLSTSLRNSVLTNFFTGRPGSLPNQGGASNQWVAAGADGLYFSSGLFSAEAAANAADVSVLGANITAAPLVLVNGFSDHFSGSVPIEGAEQRAAQGGMENWFESGQDWGAANQVLMHWLSANWTGPAQESRAASAQAALVVNVWLAIPFSSLAGQRVASVSVASSPEPGLQVPAYAVGVAREAGLATLSGRDTEWLEKAASGTGILARAACTSETFCTSAGPSSGAACSRAQIGTLLEAAGTTGQGPAPLDSRRGPEWLTTGGSAPVNPASSELLLYLQMVDSVSRFGLFPIDGARAGAPVSDDNGGMKSARSTTAAYLATEQSSIWSILTTSALVLVPRQKRPQPTILVVDPDDATRDAVNVALVGEGYFVLPAANVHDAWGMLRTPHARIDLVLMDPHLPDVSGIHLCARLREISPTLPVMVCAGEVEPAEVDQLRQLGVRYYLRKPIAFEELLHTVKAILA